MHAPYHIQRGTIRTPLADVSAKLSDAVKLDYMGSSEFEYGALPKSFREIEAVADAWKQRVVPEIEQGGLPLLVYGAMTDEEFAEYRGHLSRLRDGSARTLESTYFEADHAKRFKLLTCDFWWDIDNAVMFGFNKHFMQRLPYYVAVSIKFMNEKKAAAKP